MSEQTGVLLSRFIEEAFGFRPDFQLDVVRVGNQRVEQDLMVQAGALVDVQCTLEGHLFRVYGVKPDFQQDLITVQQIRVMGNQVLHRAAQIGFNSRVSWHPGGLAARRVPPQAALWQLKSA